MTENQPGDENLRKEFEALGKNLVEALRSAWSAPESRRLRDEITNGLGDLGGMLKREAEELASSPAANKVRSSVEEVGEKLRTQEVQTKVRGELIGALQTVNNELQKVIDRWGGTAPSTTAGEAASEPAETPAPEPPTASPTAATGFPTSDFSQPAPDETNISGFEDKPQDQP